MGRLCILQPDRMRTIDTSEILPRPREGGPNRPDQDRRQACRFSIKIIDHDRPPASNIRPGTLGRRSKHLRTIARRQLWCLTARRRCFLAHVTSFCSMCQMQDALRADISAGAAIVGLRGTTGTLDEDVVAGCTQSEVRH
jgi:hypothetical protein